MKIFIGYPPLGTSKGIPLLSQNRQFQYFKKPTYIYPVVPASAATLLKQAGYQVIWNDCIAEGWSLAKFYSFVAEEKPDLIAWETKTPVIQEHWGIINRLKELSAIGCRLYCSETMLPLCLKSPFKTAKLTMCSLAAITTFYY